MTEVRRIYVRCRNCSPAHLGRHLGDQAEVEVVTRTIEAGLFVPLYAISQYNGRDGRVWTLEDGKLKRRIVKFADRLLDGRVLVAETLPDGVHIVTTRDASHLREGRQARAVGSPP